MKLFISFFILTFICGPVALAATLLEPLSQPLPPPLRDLTTLRSDHGFLRVAIDAAPQDIHLGNQEFKGFVYNGDYAGPLLRVKPGDVMQIHFTNHIGERSNLHFHGIHSSPRGNSDNIHVMVKSGDSYDYEIKVPDDQPPGLYWYHDHMHGSVGPHVSGGLSGAFIVEGLEQQIPALKNMRQKIMVLKDRELEHSDPYFHKLIQTINGQTQSRIDMRPGETQLWRISNQSSGDFFTLALPGHKFRVIANDGAARTTVDEVETLKIQPAGRVEVLVDAGAAGTYPLLSQGTVTGSGDAKTTDRVLGYIKVAGKPVNPMPQNLTMPPSTDLRQGKIDAERDVVFTEDNDDKHFYLNGEMFDEHRMDARVPLGSVEQWTVKNDTDDLHVFHIHQINFQVTEIKGEPQPFTGYVDTVYIPERSAVKVLLPFTSPQIVGKFIYHCHILKHEDHGMMANIEIYDPNAPDSASDADEAMPEMDMGMDMDIEKSEGDTHAAM